MESSEGRVESGEGGATGREALKPASENVYCKLALKEAPPRKGDKIADAPDPNVKG